MHTSPGLSEDQTSKKYSSFKRRHFKNIGQIIGDSFRLLREWPQIRAVMNSKFISAEFRERLMLAVTEVNQCRYCSYAHTKMALQSGLGSGEIRQILQHNLQACPEEEIPAILYAQHWAETDGHPDPGARLSLEKQYGSAKSDMIEIILRLMRMGNMIGNSLDYILYRISFGHWGN